MLTQLASTVVGCPSGTEMRSIIRGGVFLQETTTSEFTDATVAAGQTYQCAIAARDYHLNDSTQTSFSVRAPPANRSIPSRAT